MGFFLGPESQFSSETADLNNMSRKIGQGVVLWVSKIAYVLGARIFGGMATQCIEKLHDKKSETLEKLGESEIPKK